MFKFSNIVDVIIKNVSFSKFKDINLDERVIPVLSKLNYRKNPYKKYKKLKKFLWT